MERLPTIITENGIHYTPHGDHCFADPDGPEEDRPVGKWGRMHLNYLKEHRPGLYTQLILSGKQHQYLADLNEQAQDRMLRAGRMNSIRQRAEEPVVSELVLS